MTIKQKRWVGRLGECDCNWGWGVVREGLTEGATLEQRPKQGEGGNSDGAWGGALQAEGSPRTQAPRPRCQSGEKARMAGSCRLLWAVANLGCYDVCERGAMEGPSRGITDLSFKGLPLAACGRDCK